jgi:hypothetical protein
MNGLKRFLGLALLFATLGATGAKTEGIDITQERQAYLEGVWNGVNADTSADKLCSNLAPQATTLSIEFMRSGGMAFADGGDGEAVRGRITDASETNGVISLAFGNEVWRLRPENDKVMAKVRTSASLAGDVDTMYFKRCKKAADRSAIDLDDDSLNFLAADLPGEEAFFMDERLAAKTGDRCAVNDTQYLFFVLLGPSEFRLSRWNSFALADKLASKKAVKMPPLDEVANWAIESARKDGNKYVLRMRDYDNKDAVPETIHVEVKAGGAITIPEWKRNFLRCKGFQSRS